MTAAADKLGALSAQRPADPVAMPESALSLAEAVKQSRHYRD
ncbi:hypothetical protein [Bradyrhizobium sp. CCBAU 11386]|nr:hypothetical protein [Bradyrhizobium sp. CCBAU 11386]